MSPKTKEILSCFSASLSTAAYRVYLIGLGAQTLPAVLARPLTGVCDLIVRFVQKCCDAMLVLFIHPEMDYNPVRQRLIDRQREIAGRLTGVSEGDLTQMLRACIAQNNGGRTSGAPESAPSKIGKEPLAAGRAELSLPRFGVVIPFYRHLHFFEDCLRSVAIAAESLQNGDLSVVVVNDDPQIEDAVLESRVPAQLKACTQILGNKGNIGISRTLNRGIMASTQPWLLLLDCDDKIHPTCFQVLKKAIQRQPDTIYFSSQMMLINDRDESFGYHFRSLKICDQTENLAASHLKIFRRELFAEIGYH
ncbi:MAG: glycosyltransferase family 2 protein, partial [Verrucomicrobia bacterium]|nr:glycosyltransferase family 2 protein [Verrucomicrobiota bacterium]